MSRAPFGVLRNKGGAAVPLPFLAAQKIAVLMNAASAPFAPTDLAGLQFWTKAYGTLWQDSARTTSVTADADPVGSADDASGNGKHALQATASQRLTYKVNIQNGKPMLLCDNVDDVLTTASIAHGIGTGDFYWAIVLKTGSTVASWRDVLSNGTYAPGLFVHAGKLDLYWGGDNDSAADLAINTVYICEVFRASGVVNFVINGVADANTPTVATSMANAALSLGADPGGGEAFNGYIGEALTYSALPTAGQRASLRAYLNKQWAVY